MLLMLSSCIGASHVLAYSAYDFDNDGLTDALEVQYGTDVRSADTDKDGYLDGEEVFDLGTDPTTPTSSIFSEEERSQGIRHKLFSLKDESTLVGSSLYLKGVADTIDSEIPVNIHGIRTETDKKTIEKTLTTDYRGVFSEIISLDSLCYERVPSQQQLSLSIEHEILLERVQLRCHDKDITSEVLEDITVGDRSIGEELLFEEGDSIVLRLNLASGYELQAAFASIIFSSGFLADSQSQTVAFSPVRMLEAGKHTLILSVFDPNKKIQFPPMAIPLEVYPSSSPVSLKAELPLVGWLIVPFILFLVPIFTLLARSLQKRD